MMRKVLSVLVCLLLAGCFERELPYGFNARESLEAVVALARADIAAEASPSGPAGKESYTITVPESKYSQALKVVHELGLPRRAQQTPEELTRSESLVPQSAELAAARLDLALSAQAERLLSALPSVVEAHVSIMSELAQSAADRSPRASVVIRYDSPSGKRPFELDAVKRLVAQTVPGLAPEKVLVEDSRVHLSSMQPILGVDTGGESSVVNLTRLSPFMFQVPEMEKTAARRQLALVILVFSLAGCVVGVYAGWITGVRKGLKAAGARLHQKSVAGIKPKVEPQQERRASSPNLR